MTDNAYKALASWNELDAIRVTSLAHFMECPKSWKVQMMGEVPRKESKYSRIGTAVHLIIEHFLRGEFELFTTEAQTYWAYAAAQGVETKERQNLLKYLQTIADYRESVVALEHEFILPVIAGALPLKGHIDLLVANSDGTLMIVDHKTNRGLEGAEKWSKKIQQIAYAWAGRRLLPQFERIAFQIGYVNLDTQVMWMTDPADDLWFEKQFSIAWEEFRVYSRRSEWPERLNGNCGWCPLQSDCPTFKQSMSLLLPPSGPSLPSGESLSQRVIWLETALKAGAQVLENLKSSLIESTLRSGGELHEDGNTIKVQYSTRRKVDERIAWATLMEILNDHPELDPVWQEMMEDALTFKVGGAERLAKRAEEFRPIIERAITSVTSDEPHVRILPARG